MLFSEISYQRPDLTHYKEKFTQTTQEFVKADDYPTAKVALEKLNHLRGEIAKNMKLAYIRHSIDTKDPFYRDENDFWDHHAPLVDQIHNHFYESLLSSPFRKQLESDFPATLFLFAEDQLRLLDDSVIELKQQENEAISQYSQLIASAELDFDGKKRTLAELSAFFTVPDRKTRKSAQAVYESFFVAHEQEFDNIYDQLVKVRHQQAQKLGFKNYVEYGDRLMNR